LEFCARLNRIVVDINKVFEVNCLQVCIKQDVTSQKLLLQEFIIPWWYYASRTRIFHGVGRFLERLYHHMDAQRGFL